MDPERPDNRLANGLLWHRPQVQRLIVTKATSTIKVLKEGSTEDFFTHASDWPAGVVGET
jgi:hypothetical protein